MVECVVRLRQLVYGQRCIICTRDITPERPASIILFDLAVCIDPACGAIALDTSVGELDDVDKAARNELYRIATTGRPKGFRHVVPDDWAAALCGQRLRAGAQWHAVAGERASCA